jgi:hypothetical protein
MQTRSVRPVTLGSVSLGANFVFRTAEILGAEYANTRKPTFEGQVLTVVGFKPRYVNQVVVQDSNGHECLLRLSDVEKALSLRPAPGSLPKEGIPSAANQTKPNANGGSVDLTDVLEFIRSTDVVIWDQLIHEMNATTKHRNVEAARRFNVGNQVAYESRDRSNSFRGIVLHISRAGRLIVGLTSEGGVITKRVNLPASYVKRVD